MIRTIVNRIVQLVLTVLLATTVLFGLIHASGDPTQGFMAPGASIEAREAVRERLGLNRSLPAQYLSFIGRSLVFDFGDSWKDHRPAFASVGDRIPATLLLGGTSLAMVAVFGSMIGLVSSTLSRGPLRTLVRLIPLAGQAIPTFWLGAMLMLVFAVRLGWLPSSGNATPSALVLPAVTLALQPMSLLSRLFQTSMEDVARSDYVRTARAKGLPEHDVSVDHIARNALLPSLAFLGLQGSFLVGGAVIVETIYAWPGIGQFALQSAMQRDVPIIHAVVVLMSVGIVTINVLVDLVAAIIDPRLRGAGVQAHA